MQRGQWAVARNTLYAALDRDPRSPRIHNALAVVHTELGQAAEAMEALMLALEADTRYAPALFNLAVLYDTRLADGDQARAFYKRFISAAPRDPRAEAARAALGRLEASGPLALVPVPDSPREPVVPPAGEPEDVPFPGAEAPVAVAPVPPPPDPAVAAFARSLAEASDLLKAGRVAQGLDRYEAVARQAAEAGQIENEERALREAVRLAVDQPRAHALLAHHLYRRGRYEEAGRAYGQAAALNAEYAPAQLGLARMAVRDSNYDAALFHFRKAAASDPTLADARWELAQLMDINLKAPERAAQTYREFAATFPADPRRRAALERADELAPPPRPPPAVATVPPRGTVTPPPDPATARRLPFNPAEIRNPTAALNAFNRAARYYEQQQWDQAIFFYLRALENDDQFVSAYYNLGLCYTTLGDNELARDAYRRAIRLQPDNLNAKYNLALLYREIRDDRSALRLLEEIVRVDPAYASAHQALGLMYAAREDGVAKAKQHYTEFLRLAPNDRSAPTIRQWIAAH
jgi:tetratricopeptide (TPR) repeat protein